MDKQKNNNQKKEQIKRIIKIPAVGFALLAIILNYFLEVLSRHSFIKPFKFIVHSPLVFFYNAFIIFVTLSLVLFAKRKVFATIFVCAMWIISAFANWIVLCFRTTPFSAVDILMLRNVMTMLDKYMTKWQMVLSAIGAVLVVMLLIYLYFKLPKSKSKRRPFRASAYVCMCIILIYTLTKVAVNTKTVSDNFGNLAYAYNDYGFAYCFSNSIIDVGISKPKNYSEQAVHEITDVFYYNKNEVVFASKDEVPDDLEEETVEVHEAVISNEDTGEIQEAAPNGEDTEELQDTTANNEETDEMHETVANNEEVESGKKYYTNEPATKQFPNIIVIQLESIFDTKYMKDLRVTERVMPTLANLKGSYSHGFFTVPAVGAGTANTEFEVQTGMSTQFFGAGEYPFKTVMKSKSCDSMAYDLKRHGYATAGFHNNDATFYERYIDYSNLGFDVFTAMEYMYFLQYTPRGWAKDNILDNEMIERMKQTEGRDYITTITVQAHGRYPKKHTDTLTHIGCHFTGEYEGDVEKEAAWEYYINQCRETDNMLKDLIKGLEELDEPTVVFMYGDHLPSLNLLETDLRQINLYQTEWVMWDNIGLESEYKDMTSYQASTYIFDRLGIEGGLMQNFHKKYMNQPDKEDYLNKLEMLEYDTLYGSNYAFDCNNPFPKTEMKLGIRDIVVEGIEEGKNVYFVKGKGFNTFSQVIIDGESIDTTYLNYTTLTIPKDAMEDATELCVAQVGDDHIELSRTDSLLLKDTENTENINDESTSIGDTTENSITENSTTEDNTTEDNTTKDNTEADNNTTEVSTDDNLQ